MTVREETSLIEPTVALLGRADQPVGADAHAVAKTFLNGSLAVAVIGVLVAVGAALVAGLALPWPVIGAAVLVLGLAAALNRGQKVAAAGWLVLVSALLALALAAYGWPEALPGALLAASLLIPFAAGVLGRAAALATLLALLALALALWLAALAAPLIAVAAGAVFALQTASALVLLRHSAANRDLVQLHAEELARLGRQAEAQRGEHRSTLDDLERERRRSADLVERLAEGVLAVDAEGLIRQSNDAARQIWQELVGGAIEGQPLALLGDALARSGDQPALEIVQAGAWQGDAQQYILADTRALAASERLRTELVDLIALKMRNPLTSMLTALEMTLGEQLPDGIDRVLAGARRSGQDLLDTVTTLIEVNELEHLPAPLRRSPSSLRPLVEAAIAQATPLAQQRAVNLVVEYTADGIVDVDAERLRRAIVYLLENAVRSSPDYSTVQVQAERQGNDLLLRVVDQGPGIDASELPLVFQRYIVTGEQGGVPAIGLTFCRLVVEAHGGRIWVESSAHGSTFAFALPLEAV